MVAKPTPSCLLMNPMGQKSDRTLSGWLVSAAQYLGFQLENVKATGENCLKALSFVASVWLTWGLPRGLAPGFQGWGRGRDKPHPFCWPCLGSHMA